MTQAEHAPTVEQAFALYNEGDREQAEKVCLEALRNNPQDVAGMRLLAKIARENDNPEQAVQMLTFAMKLAPNDPNVAGEMGTSLVLAGRAKEATDLLDALVKLMPEEPMAQYWLGRAYLEQYQGNPAARCFRKAYELDPSNDQLLSMIGLALLAAGRGLEAEPWLRKFARKYPDSVSAIHNLASAINQQQRSDEAIALYRKALELDPNYHGAIGALARYHRIKGNYGKAMEIVEDAIERLGPKPQLVSIYSLLCARQDKVDEGIKLVEKAFESKSLSAHNIISLNFAMGRLQEKAKNYDKAWESFSRANAMYPQTYNIERETKNTDEMLNTFNAWTYNAIPRASIPTEKPIFIVGMPRSGTTLIEQILSSHPDCFGAGELLVVPRMSTELSRRLGSRWPIAIGNLTQELADEYAQRYIDHISALEPDAKRIVDKLPHNFVFIGLISLLFPQAHVIHCIRNPLDVSISNYSTPLSPKHTWRPNLTSMGHAYNQYRRLMNHWREHATIPILDVVYEDTIQDVERQARRVLDFVGLPWNDRCLKFYEHSRAVTTASTDQVRKPIYQSSKERWRRYESHIGPLVKALEEGGTKINQPFDVERFS